MHKILAIDDQQDNLITIKAVLKGHIPECEVLTALSAKEGIEIAKNEQPDTILLDIIMPNMDGYEACKRLKADVATSHIPVVMVTAIRTDSESRVKGLEIGADAFLAKPIDPIELTAQVKVMLRIKKAENKLREEKELLEERVIEKTNELRESEAKLKSIFRAAPTGIGVTVDRNFQFVNQKLIEMLGYSASELIGQNARKVYLSDEEYERVGKYKYDQIKESGTGTIETQFLRKDGSLIDLLLSSTPIDFNDFSKGVTFTATDITQRKQDEEALKSSEDRLNIIFDSAPIPYFISDMKGTFLDGNKAAEKLIGQKKEELIGKNIFKLKLLSEIDLATAAKAISNSLLGKQTGPDEVLFKNKDGRKIPVEITTYPVKIENKTVVLGIAQDISERKKAEEELKKNEEFTRRIIASSNDCIKVLDLDGNLTYMSEGGQDKLEIDDIEPYLNNSWTDFWKDEDNEAALNTISKAKKGESAIFTGYCPTAKGTPKWWEIIISPIKNIEGKTESLLAISRDMTERKRTELIQKALYNISNAVITTKDLEQLIGNIRNELGSVIDTTNFYIALYDSETHTLSLPYLSDEKVDISSFDAAKTLTNYVIETNKPQLISKKKLKELEKDGEVKSIGSTAEIWLGVPLKIDNKINGVLAVQSYTDESAFDESDMELLEFVADQISISIDRKKAEEDLINALIKAQESDRLKSAFLANMSHEIRTPMNGILGFAGLLKKPDLSGEKQQKYVKVIETSGIRMLNLINNLINISKLEAGQMTVSVSSTNINDQIRELFTFFNPEVEQKNMQLTYKIPLSDKEAIIHTDYEKLYAILTNLIKNAIKYSDKGSIEFGYKLIKPANSLVTEPADSSVTEPVEVLVTEPADSSVTEPVEVVEFYIKDTGIGIPHDRQKAIFDRFVQADIEDKEVREGSGLGLAISKAYIEMLGGRIWLESEPGKGSQFHFTIPINHESNDINKSPKKNIVKRNDSKRKNLRVLIAEDDEVTSVFLTEVLKSKCEKILYSKTGKETIELCKKNKDLNLILMDIKMPDMNGYEATKKIRTFNKEITIIAQTAFAITGSRIMAIAAGCDEYVSKPIDPAELFGKIEKLIDG